MLFNIEKCKVMHFGHHNQEMDYTLDNRVLQKVHEEWDLGVIILVDMKALLQCVEAYSTANRILGVINRSIDYKSGNILLNLYKSLVRPRLEYCTGQGATGTSSQKVYSHDTGIKAVGVC